MQDKQTLLNDALNTLKQRYYTRVARFGLTRKTSQKDICQLKSRP